MCAREEGTRSPNEAEAAEEPGLPHVTQRGGYVATDTTIGVKGYERRKREETMRK